MAPKDEDDIPWDFSLNITVSKTFQLSGCWNLQWMAMLNEHMERLLSYQDELNMSTTLPFLVIVTFACTGTHYLHYYRRHRDQEQRDIRVERQAQRLCDTIIGWEEAVGVARLRLFKGLPKPGEIPTRDNVTAALRVNELFPHIGHHTLVSIGLYRLRSLLLSVIVLTSMFLVFVVLTLGLDVHARSKEVACQAVKKALRLYDTIGYGRNGTNVAYRMPQYCQFLGNEAEFGKAMIEKALEFHEAMSHLANRERRVRMCYGFLATLIVLFVGGEAGSIFHPTRYVKQKIPANAKVQFDPKKAPKVNWFRQKLRAWYNRIPNAGYDVTLSFYERRASLILLVYCFVAALLSAFLRIFVYKRNTCFLTDCHFKT